MVDLKDILTYLQQLQQSICSSLEILDGNALFADDEWQD